MTLTKPNTPVHHTNNQLTNGELVSFLRNRVTVNPFWKNTTTGDWLTDDVSEKIQHNADHPGVHALHLAGRDVADVLLDDRLPVRGVPARRVDRCQLAH